MSGFFEPLRVRDSIWKICVCLVLVLVLVDVIFICVSFIRDLMGLQLNRWHVTPGISFNEKWHISFDGGYGEQWQYIKWGAVALMCTAMSIRSRSKIHLAWGLIFFYLLIDDSLQVHDKLGIQIGRTLGLVGAFGLRPDDFGELIVSACVAIPLLGFLVFAHFGGAGRDQQAFSFDLLVLLAALLFFGVGIDMLDIMVPPSKTQKVLNLAEDGGEMIVASLMVAYVALVWLRSEAQARATAAARP